MNGGAASTAAAPVPVCGAGDSTGEKPRATAWVPSGLMYLACPDDCRLGGPGALPAAPRSMLDPAAPRPASDMLPRAGAAVVPDPHAPRVLLVDDEPVIRAALRRFFVRQGWTVEEAGNGTEALRHLLGDAATGRQAGDYAVIISDLRMPGVSGIELHARLSAERPELLDRLILSTGDSVSIEAAEFLRRARCPVLNKPFELAELRAMVARVRGTT